VLRAHHHTDAATALVAAETFLSGDPVANNIVLWLLADRIARPLDGNYWWVTDNGTTVAFAIQTPVGNVGIVIGSTDAVEPLVVEMQASAPDLPGVLGETQLAAGFAAKWAEATHQSAAPVEHQRLHVVESVQVPADVSGALRRASDADVAVLGPWVSAFYDEVGTPLNRDPFAALQPELDVGSVWLWANDGPVSLAIATPPAHGVSRVRCVFTPPEHRGRGYAAAVTAGASLGALAAGAKWCVLYTQLTNPTASAVYRRIGYRAVAERLSYRFG
jgi:predicted GNAT family acetyltransferase